MKLAYLKCNAELNVRDTPPEAQIGWTVKMKRTE